jgi:hypothetical protein
VETAVELAAAVAGNHLVRQAVIPQLHVEMQENIALNGRFADHYNWPPA